MKKIYPRISCIYCFQVTSGNPERIGHKYVGQTIDFYDRKRDHLNLLLKNKHDNSNLQSYYNKYGKDSLEFFKLQECGSSELNFWEKWWIKCFDSKNKGFNCTDGGENPPIISKSGSLQNIKTKEIVNFDSYADFGRKIGCDLSSVSKLMRRKSKSVKGWCLVNENPKKQHFVVSPDGNIFSLDNATFFCKKHNINLPFVLVL